MTEELKIRKSKQVNIIIAAISSVVLLAMVLFFPEDMNLAAKSFSYLAASIFLGFSLYNYFDSTPQIILTQRYIKTKEDFILWESVLEFSFDSKAITDHMGMNYQYSERGMYVKTKPSNYVVFISFEELEGGPEQIANSIEKFINGLAKIPAKV